ncbi:caspase family protein [Microseira wollei]|uniref:Peptidase C14, caspase catalytic subunit p20 n=1 Tax=Microseira wollei NIES-4236 TaxID=2530354 RepID=A0AAV3XJT8_9CYAN|nr:caspase family protein [Microseira wollei]GET41871.1 peptidase C14, caspase catalytic subunit p20 [Microseira wollei NIES-4236]
MNNLTSKIYALLIGIDCYLPNKLPDGVSYKSLRGCVRDINHVEAFMKEIQKVPETQILKLTASNSETDQPSEPPENWPTYKNIVAKFQQLAEMAQPGDQVYIQYSGHGGRTVTAYPELKGKDDNDESIVTTNIGTAEGQYLRDIELAYLLKQLVDKGLIVTVVFDSCHSGGVTRSGDVDIRGAEEIDQAQRPTESLVASPEELAKNWYSIAAGKSGKPTAGWISGASNYVFLAACRPNEFAYESAFGPTKERNGALTYWLLDTLRQQTPELTYQDLHDRVKAKVNSHFTQQTPMLIGEGNRLVFGSDRIEMQYAVTVMQVDLEKSQVLLATGQAAGLRKGAEFAIYSLGTKDFAQTDKRLALAEIQELGATQSWCELKPIPGQQPVQQGDKAVPISASENLVRKVHLLSLTESLSPGLLAAKDALAGNGWVELADDAADYIVAVNDAGEYEICDRSGAPIANVQPLLKVTDPNAPATLAKRLVHLTKYYATQSLDNFDKSSPLMGKLVVELIGKQQDYDPVDPPRPEPFDDPENPTVKSGEWIFLRIRNDHINELNVTVLDLQSDWAISQIYPFSAGEKFITISPGQEEEAIAFCMILPDELEEGVDIFKVFATVGEANFRWLELPPLTEAIAKAGSRSASNPLEELLANIAGDPDEAPLTRKANPAAYPSREWTTKQVKITVKKAL